jgi:hypothetical protein
MATSNFKCSHCKKRGKKEIGLINRAKSINAPIFCDRVCFGLSRRIEKTTAQKKAMKAEYDRQYRALNLKEIKRKKHEYFLRTYDPVVAAEERKKTMPRHADYCRRPEYKEYKREYDRRLRASQYGEFAEAYMILLDVDREVNSRISDYETRVANGTLNKALQRKRDYENSFSL